MKFLLFYILLFSFENVAAQNTKQESNPTVEKIAALLKKSDEFINNNLDSSLFYSKKANQLITNLPQSADKYEVYKSLSEIYLVKGNYVSSLEYLIKASKINDAQKRAHPTNTKFELNSIEIQMAFGSLNLYQNNLNVALDDYKKAMYLLEKIDLPKTEKLLQIKLKILNNTAAAFLKKREFKRALAFFESARELNSKLKDSELEASLLNNIGICHLEDKDYADAIFYFEQALNLRESLKDSRGIAQCYNNLGKAYALTNKYEQANHYFNESLRIGKQIGNAESIMHSLQSLETLYALTQDYKKAYLTKNEFTNLKDSLDNKQTIKKIAQLEMNYKLDKQKEHYELNLKKEKAEKEKATLWYYLIGTCLLLTFALLILFIYTQKTKIKNINLSNEKLELEHKNISLEKNKLNEDLEFQNREMTSKMMYLLKKNELLGNISTQLTDLKKISPPQNQQKIQEIISTMRQKKDDDLWQEFETYFTKVHPDFYVKLHQLFPDLTPNEKKLCAFLRLNMSSKDISTITYQSINSITVSRSRLRKKLNIQGEDILLNNFLMNL